MSFRKRLEVVPFKEVKDTLAEERGNQTYVVPEVEILEKRNAFARFANFGMSVLVSAVVLTQRKQLTTRLRDRALSKPSEP